MLVPLTDKIKKLLTYTIGMAMLMEMLDASVLNTALPQMARSFHVPPVQLKIILTVYFLSLGVFIPISGWAADRYGEKNTLLFALALFVCSSMACGLSTHLEALVLFRLLQGMGGAFLMPVGRQIIARCYQGLERSQAMANINIIALMGLLSGPVVGGFMTTYVTWRWIFFINVPFGLVGIYLVYFYLPVFRERIKTQFDLIGFALVAMMLGSLLSFLDILIEPSFSLYLKLMLLVISVSAFWVYLKHVEEAPAALIGRGLFLQPGFTLATATSFLVRMTTTTHPFLVPLLLQTGYTYSAFQSGLIAVPVIVSTLVCMVFLTRILKRFAHEQLLIINSCLLWACFVSFAAQAFKFNLVFLIVQQVAMGALTTLQVALMNMNIYSKLFEPYISQGITVNSGVIQISGSFGIALAALTMVVVIGPNDLQHRVPLPAFQVVFIVQSFYLLAALILFIKNYQGRPEAPPNLEFH